MTYLERIVQALVLVTPWCMAVRYKTLAHCVEASVGGAGALKRRRVDARPLPCAVVACNPDVGGLTYIHTVGHSAASVETAYAIYCRRCDDPLSFEEWTADATFPETDTPLHMIIEARHCGKRVLVDLTAGQVREASGGRIPAPNTVVHYGDGWPSLDLGGGAWLEYGPSPFPAVRRAPWRDCEVRGLVGDMHDLMGLALDLDLNADLFNATMRRLAQSVDFPGR